MGDIAEKLRITVGSLTTSVNRLVKKGYIVRRDDEKDRRKVLLELTESAQKVLKVHEEFHNHLIDSLFLDMKIEDEVVLIKSLENILSFFKLKLN
jgi:DNA-binding MarR family transcriptional regulator